MTGRLQHNSKYCSNDATQTVTSTYLNQGDLAQADALLGSFVPESIEEENWATVNEVFLSLLRDNLDRTGADSTQEALIRTIAETTPVSLAAVNAQSYLFLKYEEEYVLPEEGVTARAKTHAESMPDDAKALSKDYIFKVQPNPFNDKISLIYQTPENAGEIRVEVINANGTMVIEKTLNRATESMQSINVHTESLPSGLYLIVLNIDGQRVETVKMTKVK